MIKRAIDATYHGTRDVSRADRQHLSRYLRCARPHVNQARIHRRLRDAKAAWRLRRNPPLSYAEASWYDDAGQTASGWHATYGVANKYLAFGTRVHFVYGGRSVDAIVDDRGPYVGNRVWDLNEHTAAALAFGGLGVVGYHIG
jgi:rare lipoprotein A (peptidoglycan hydrolase)